MILRRKATNTRQSSEVSNVQELTTLKQKVILKGTENKRKSDENYPQIRWWLFFFFLEISVVLVRPGGSYTCRMVNIQIRANLLRHETHL